VTQPANATVPEDKVEFAPIQDVPGLPRVLLLGDSISIGYTLKVRELLAGRANVHRPPENCNYTAFGLKRLDTWLGQKPWDVIHFNFGLHDLKYADANFLLVDTKIGKQVATVEQYASNLQKIVERLKQTNAKLIWCNTTPVPADSPGRIGNDEIPYNAAAAGVMKEHGIPTTDLWTIVKNHPALQLPNNVHFTKEGYDTLAQAVATSIKAALPEKP
jgi:acyl-CoA thioesterase-1